MACLSWRVMVKGQHVALEQGSWRGLLVAAWGEGSLVHNIAGRRRAKEARCQARQVVSHRLRFLVSAGLRAGQISMGSSPCKHFPECGNLLLYL